MIPIILDIIFISIIPISISKIYQNINNEIQLSKISQIKSMDIKSYEEYVNYLKNRDFIISLFHVFWCGHCKQFKPIFDKASSYDILNKKWLFLKIDCSAYSYICNILNVQFYPTIKIYKGKKILYKDPPRELKPLLHFLYKISDNPLIPINSKNNFFEKYGEYSPLIEYNKNNNESEFMKCIHNLSNNEFLEDFYFGIYKSKNNKEKIIFDYNSINSSDIVYEWNGNCTMAFNFLFLNKYPLMTEINQNFLEEISNDFRTIIFVVTFMTNKIINNFVFTSLKNLSYKKRKYIFGFADYNSDIYISKFFNFNLNNNNEMKLIIYDFNKRVYYIHDKLFNFEKQNEKDKVTMIFTTHDMQDIEQTCNRLIIIDKGSIMYDGSLHEIRNKYGTSRELIAEFNEETRVQPINDVIIEDKEDRRVSFTFDNNVTDVNKLMHEILGKYSVRDITVKEPEIESIIQKMYTGEAFV